MNKINKTVKKQLISIAQQIPAIPVVVPHLVLGADILSSEKWAHVKKEGIDARLKYKVYEKGAVGVRSAINHYKRIEKAYVDNGEKGVAAYLMNIKKLINDYKIQTSSQD